MSSFWPQVYRGFSGFLWKFFGFYLGVPIGIPSIPKCENLGTRGKVAGKFWSKTSLL